VEARFAMKGKLLVIGLAACALLAAAGGVWWWRAGAQWKIVEAARPDMPDLSTASVATNPIALAALREHIRAADARARRRLTAARGLAELGPLYQANGYLEEAARCYAGLEKLAPSQPRWPHFHATILAGYGEIEPAMELWRRVIQLAPDYVPARLRLGDCLLKSNRPTEAATAYDAVLKLSPNNPYALLNLARIDLEAQRWDQARARLETVVQQTNFALGYDLIVSLYERIGLRQQAAAIRGSAKASGAYRDPPDPWLDGLMEVCFDPYRLALVAGVAGVSGDTATARRLLERAIALAPSDVSAHFQLGGLALTQRDHQLAREQFESCTVLAPDFSDGWAQLSALQEQMGEHANAERTLAAGLAHCPNSPGLHLMRARRLRETGLAAEAITEFETSIRLRPNEPEAYTELGSLYIELGEMDAGIRKMHEALEADPGDPMALGVLAFHAISTNNEAEANRWLQRVANQPRIQSGQSEPLLRAYRQTFGRDWKPANPD
jgi:tetratricopeptide (TPR) repeat protein